MQGIYDISIISCGLGVGSWEFGVGKREEDEEEERKNGAGSFSINTPYDGSSPPGQYKMLQS